MGEGRGGRDSRWGQHKDPECHVVHMGALGEGQAARLAFAERREPTALHQDGAVIMTTFAKDNLPK